MALIQIERGLTSQKILEKTSSISFPTSKTASPTRRMRSTNRNQKPKLENTSMIWARMQERANFVSACYDALRDEGDMDLQQQILNTLAWRNKQISLIQTQLKRLEREGLLQRRNVVKDGFQELSRSRDISPEVHGRLWAFSSVRRLLYPTGDDKVPSLVRDGVELLFKKVVERYIDSSSLEKAAHRIHDITTQAESG